MAKIIKVKNRVESNCINFPVGYIYLSAVEINPETYFGGTWEQIKDKFLLMAGDTYSAGTTGGEATHKLTWNEMPKHNHGVSGGTYGGTGVSYAGGSGISVPNPTSAITIGNAGNDQPHNNMPPYLTVYGYKKIA